MCAWCNACLNGLVSYCEKFICDAEACKFWTLQESNPKGDPEVVWWCHCPSQFFVSQHAPCLMLGWLCFWPWSLAWAIVGASRMYDLGQFLVHLTDADTNSPGGCAIISVSPDIYFFFCHAQGFFLLCQAFFLIHHLPFPIFISPFWSWRLQSLALTALWHMSLIAVEGKVLSGWVWTWGRAGWVDSGSTLSLGYWIEDIVWGTSQPRLSLEVSYVHSSHPASVLCFVSWSQMKQKFKPKSRDESSGWVGIVMWNARLMWALCASHLPFQQNVQVEGQRPTLPSTRGQGSGHSHVLGSETSSWITAVFTLLDILHTCDSWLFSQIWKKSVKEQCASADRWARWQTDGGWLDKQRWTKVSQ